jgi:flagellar hook assembly protein FlgD
MPRAGPLEVSIHDPMGRRVRQFLERTADAGSVHLAWDGLDERGREAAAGVYIVRARAAERTCSARVVLMK